MLLALRSLWECSGAVVTTISGKPRRRPLRRKPREVTPGWWMIPVDAGGEITDEEFLLLSSIDLD